MSENEKNEEKIVSLNEDSKQHDHDSASYEKLVRQQQVDKQTK